MCQSNSSFAVQVSSIVVSIARAVAISAAELLDAMMHSTELVVLCVGVSIIEPDATMPRVCRARSGLLLLPHCELSQSVAFAASSIGFVVVFVDRLLNLTSLH